MEKVVHKYKLGEEPENDLAFWLTKTPQERLAALEQMRNLCYKLIDNGSEQGFQRVYRVIKREQS